VSVRQSNLVLTSNISPDENIERRIDLGFLAKLGESATESFRLLTGCTWRRRRVSRDHVFLSGTNGFVRVVRKLIVFIDIKGVMMTTEWVPGGRAVNQHYDLQVLTTLGQRVRRKRPELWENDSCIETMRRLVMP